MPFPFRPWGSKYLVTFVKEFQLFSVNLPISARVWIKRRFCTIIMVHRAIYDVWISRFASLLLLSRVLYFLGNIFNYSELARNLRIFAVSARTSRPKNCKYFETPGQAQSNQNFAYKHNTLTTMRSAKFKHHKLPCAWSLLYGILIWSTL